MSFFVERVILMRRKWRIGVTMQNQQIRLKTINLLSRIIKPFIEEGIIAQTEANTIIANLKNICKNDSPIKEIEPKLLSQKEVADMLGIGFSNFRKLESLGEFSFRRKNIHGSVRYLNLDVIEYMLTCDDVTISNTQIPTNK